MRPYRAYTDEQIIQYATEVDSLAKLLAKLNLRPAGGNYASMKRHLKRLDINTDHWNGRGWSKDQRLKNWDDYNRARSLKPHLIQKRGHKCELCGLTEWLSQKIVLEIHHLDGDRTHNNEDNLQLLCPNCHSHTDTWRGRNKK